MHSTLYIFVSSDVDVERCSAHMNGDEAGGVEWRNRSAYRLNLSHETLLEEVAYAGIPVSDFQALMFSTSVVRSPLLDRLCEDAKLTVCGSLSEGARERLKYCSHAELWEDHIIDPEASPAALRAFGNNLVSSFQRGDESGLDGVMEPVSPLLERLREGVVAIEINQGGGDEARQRAVADTVTLLKSVVQQQGIETFVCSRPRSEDGYDADVSAGHELMNVGVFSSHFADTFFDDITSTTCLAKHLQASAGTRESSFSAVQLTAATTSNFVTCDSPEEQVVFLKVSPDECSVFYRHFDTSAREDVLLRFRLAETEDVESTLREHLARRQYRVVGAADPALDAQRVAPPADMHENVGRMMLRITGPRVLSLAAQEVGSPAGDSEEIASPRRSAVPRWEDHAPRERAVLAMPRADAPSSPSPEEPVAAADRESGAETLLARDAVRQAQESVLEMASRMEEAQAHGAQVEQDLRKEVAALQESNGLLAAQVQNLTVSLEDAESKAKVLLDQLHRSNRGDEPEVAVAQQDPPGQREEDPSRQSEKLGSPRSVSPVRAATADKPNRTSAVLFELAKKRPDAAIAPKQSRESKQSAARKASYSRNKEDVKALRALIRKK